MTGSFAHGFRLHADGGRSFDGAEFPSGRVVLDDPEEGLHMVAISMAHLLEAFPAAHVERPPQPCDHTHTHTAREGTMSAPTVGRTVLVPMDPATNNGATVAPAIITRVWSATCINVRVIADSDAIAWRTSVTFVEDLADAQGLHFWSWAPPAQD